MICFPLDNTKYEANALGAWCGTRTRGVFASDTHYVVSSNGNMTVTVGPGLAWLKADTFWGVSAFEVNPTTLKIDTADGALSRIDAICIQLDKNKNIGGIIVKKGSYTPQPPKLAAPVRNLDYDEIYVATVTVRAGATSILPSDIHNDAKIEETLCGIMRDGVTGIPTQILYDMWIAWFDEFKGDARTYFANYQEMVADLFTQYQAEIAVHRNDAQVAYDAYIQRMNTYEATAKTEFETWVLNMKAILDKEAWGHVQLEIEELQSGVPTSVLGTISIPETVPLYPRCALYKSSWAFGVGGAGLGPAGGGSVVAINTGAEFNGHDITVSAPSSFSGYTKINQLSDTMFSFMADSATETQSLVLQINN